MIARILTEERVQQPSMSLFEGLCTITEISRLLSAICCIGCPESDGAKLPFHLYFISDLRNEMREANTIIFPGRRQSLIYI